MTRAAVAALVLATWLTTSPSASTSDGQWKPAGSGLPQRAFVLSLSIEPRTSTVYAGMIWQGIYKSVDRGTTWTSLSTSFPLLGEGLTHLPPDIHALASDLVQPGVLYAGTNFSGVLKTLDGGASWSARNTGIDAVHPPAFNSPPLFRPVTALALDPSSPGTLYAAVPRLGVTKTTDGGGGWQLVFRPPTGFDMSTLVLDPSDPATMYVGTHGGGVFKRRVGGSWEELNHGLENKVIQVLVADPSQPGTLYAGTLGGGLFKTVDGGRHWRSANSGLGNKHVAAIALDPVRADAVYAGTLGGGVFASADGGRRWRPLNRGLRNRLVHALAFDPRQPGLLYAGTLGAGVFVKTS